MKRFLITGVSSGIGRTLAKDLVLKGNEVWGIARRKELLQELSYELKNSGRFFYSVADVSQEDDWKQLITEMSQKEYHPDTIIFNAAILKPDLNKDIHIGLLQETFSVNFFGVIQGIGLLLDYVKKKTQFLAISSLSAFKGSAIEGIGYPASKAALSIAFESLYLKYKNKFIFKTLFLGPVAGGVNHFKKPSFFVASEERTAQKIEQCLNKSNEIIYFPWLYFFIMRILKLFPAEVYFKLLSTKERFGNNF